MKRNLNTMETPVVARLTGGLANQMFIAAAAVAVAQRAGGNVHFDISSYGSRGNLRRFQLAYFPALAKVPIDAASNVITARRRRFWHGGNSGLNPSTQFQESSFAYDSAILHVEPPVSLRGYFQSGKYFADCEPLVRTIFEPVATPTLLETVHAAVGESFTAIHVRRGDYMDPRNRDFHGIASIPYFERSLDLLESLSHGGRPVVAFTDEPGLLPKEILTRVALVIGPDPQRHPGDDLLTMAACSALIASNSSFSWWAGFLRDACGRPVIAPRPWFKGNDLAASDLLLPHWIGLGSD